VFSSVTTIVLCCSGTLSVLKAQGLLLMALVVIVVNLINLLILEVGEWRSFLTQKERDFIQQNGMDGMMYDGECSRITYRLDMYTVLVHSGM
jgi:hypothetical protein